MAVYIQVWMHLMEHLIQLTMSLQYLNSAYCGQSLDTSFVPHTMHMSMSSALDQS